MRNIIFTLLLALTAGGTAQAEDAMLDDFIAKPETRWQFFSDRVMGGVSDGKLEFITQSDGSYAQMTGQVSLENNGGFIQFRHNLKTSVQPDQTGIKIKVRGNNQTYYVHLRTAGTILPWHYYQAAFDASDAWQEIRLPFDGFEKSNKILRKTPKPTSLKSIGIVAFGRAHIADIQIAEIGFY